MSELLPLHSAAIWLHSAGWQSQSLMCALVVRRIHKNFIIHSCELLQHVRTDARSLGEIRRQIIVCKIHLLLFSPPRPRRNRARRWMCQEPRSRVCLDSIEWDSEMGWIKQLNGCHRAFTSCSKTQTENRYKVISQFSRAEPTIESCGYCN